MLISIVMLTWNRHRFLAKSLPALFANLSGAFEYEVLITDNGSTDETGVVLEAYRDRPGVSLFTNPRNQGLTAYKRLFGRAKGDYIIDVDDDILEFPKDFDRILVEYLDAFRDYGFLALNVVQDERTNGAKPDKSLYRDDVRGNLVVENGPTGGWCTAFRRADYRKVKWVFDLVPLTMKRCEDGVLVALFQNFLRLKVGIVKDAVCLHACGPWFAERYGQTDREIEKYLAAGLTDIARKYMDPASRD